MDRTCYTDKWKLSTVIISHNCVPNTDGHTNTWDFLSSYSSTLILSYNWFPIEQLSFFCVHYLLLYFKPKNKAVKIKIWKLTFGGLNKRLIWFWNWNEQIRSHSYTYCMMCQNVETIIIKANKIKDCLC